MSSLLFSHAVNPNPPTPELASWLGLLRCPSPCCQDGSQNIRIQQWTTRRKSGLVLHPTLTYDDCLLTHVMTVNSVLGFLYPVVCTGAWPFT